MKQFLLVVCLQNDLNLSGLIASLQKERNSKVPEEHADVLQLSHNVVLLDRITAHEIFVRLCSGLLQEGKPYIVVPIHPEDAVVVGRFPKEDQAILSQYGIALTTS
ncbi:MAG: hypothetical protein WCJ37_06595 [Syntrophus sp. (in: bacteria)]